jgi:hypothetical protein
MSSLSSIRLRIPSNYYIYADPPDKEGEEALHFVSAQRRVSFRGRAFREFVQTVVPLLDGTRSPADIAGEVGTLFETADLEACLQLLREQGLLEDSSRWDLPEARRERLLPQLNLFQMLSPEPWELQRRLSN